MNRAHVAAVAALGALVVLGACTKKDENAAGDTTAAMAGSGASTGAMSTPANSTATAAAPALTDANIAWILDQANAADSSRGKLAETKGTSTDVKNFGKLMAGEHHALRAEGQALVKKLGVTPTAPAGDQSEAQAKTEMDSLNAMPKGAAWDKAYIGYEVGYHQAVLKTATAALGAAQNDSLKALIKKAAPAIQHHLDRAQAIQKKLGA